MNILIVEDDASTAEFVAGASGDEKQAMLAEAVSAARDDHPLDHPLDDNPLDHSVPKNPLDGTSINH